MKVNFYAIYAKLFKNLSDSCLWIKVVRINIAINVKIFIILNITLGVCE